MVLAGAIPGTKLGEVVTRRFGNPLYSLMVCYLCFIITTTVAASTYTCNVMLFMLLTCEDVFSNRHSHHCSPFFYTVILQGPEDKHAAYGVALLWGVTLGWISPQNTCAFVPLIPADQTTEWYVL